MESSSTGAKTTKLLGIISAKMTRQGVYMDNGRSSSSNRRNPFTHSKANNYSDEYDHDDDDPVKAMQDRMLHKALHNGDAYHSTTHTIPRPNKPVPYSSVRPLRGSLSDEKLPYLDWRLSILLLQQLQRDEQERVDCEASGKYDDHTIKLVPAQPQQQHQQQKQQHKLSGRSIVLGPVEEVDAKNSLRHALLNNNDALASIPFLDSESRFASNGSGEDEEDEDEDEDINEQYYEVSDDLDLRRDCHASQTIPPASLLPASHFHRASVDIRPSSMERSNSYASSTSRKIFRLWSRGSSRHTQTATDKGVTSSTTLIKSSTRPELHALDVNNLYYDAPTSQPSSRRWNLRLLPHMIGGS